MNSEHGQTGYKKGCRCFTCRREHNEELKRYREKKAMTDHPTGRKRLVLPDGCGAMEVRVRTLYHELGVKGAEAATLMDIGILQAKLIDSIQDNGKWHLLAIAQKSLLDINDRLVKLAKPAGAQDGPLKEDELDGFLAGLTQQPRPS